jgi:hypothetical protein
MRDEKTHSLFEWLLAAVVGVALGAFIAWVMPREEKSEEVTAFTPSPTPAVAILPDCDKLANEWLELDSETGELRCVRGK